MMGRLGNGGRRDCEANHRTALSVLNCAESHTSPSVALVSHPALLLPSVVAALIALSASGASRVPISTAGVPRMRLMRHSISLERLDLDTA
jgi:hypothetical protein